MSKAFEPFRVDWELCTPMIVPDAPIHLDALLARARVDSDAVLALDDPYSTQHNLPLEKFQVDQDWCFKASRLFLVGVGPTVQYHQVRRANVTMWREAADRGLFKRDPPFDPARGISKAVSILLPMRMMIHAHAWGVGNIVEVQLLLNRIHSLGKLKRRSSGTIKSCVVTACGGDDCLWHLRNLPLASPRLPSVSYSTSLGCLRSPYWKKENNLAILVSQATV